MDVAMNCPIPLPVQPLIPKYGYNWNSQPPSANKINFDFVHYF